MEIVSLADDKNVHIYDILYLAPDKRGIHMMFFHISPQKHVMGTTICICMEEKEHYL